MTRSPADIAHLRAARDTVVGQGITLGTAADRELTQQVFWRLIVVRGLLWTRGYAATRAWIEHRANPLPVAITPQTALQAMKIGRIANGLGRRMPFPSACLVRSLAAFWLLRKMGLAPELHLGVAKEDGLRAHAWVALCGEPVTDKAETTQNFAPFPRSSL